MKKVKKDLGNGGNDREGERRPVETLLHHAVRRKLKRQNHQHQDLADKYLI